MRFLTTLICLAASATTCLGSALPFSMNPARVLDKRADDWKGVDCDGSGNCGTFVGMNKYCDGAINGIDREKVYYGFGSGSDGYCGGDLGGRCKLFLNGDKCIMTGEEMWRLAQDIRYNPDNINERRCDACGSRHFKWVNGLNEWAECRLTLNYINLDC